MLNEIIFHIYNRNGLVKLVLKFPSRFCVWLKLLCVNGLHIRLLPMDCLFEIFWGSACHGRFWHPQEMHTTQTVSEQSIWKQCTSLMYSVSLDHAQYESDERSGCTITLHFITRTWFSWTEMNVDWRNCKYLNNFSVSRTAAFILMSLQRLLCPQNLQKMSATNEIGHVHRQ